MSEASSDPTHADHLSALKNLSAEEMKLKIEALKAQEALEAEMANIKLNNRLKAIADAVAAGKAAFAVGRYEEAERHFDTALLENPENRCEIVCNRAACALKMERFHDALCDASEVVNMEPTYVKAHYRLALAQQGLGRTDRAIKACRDALMLEPENAQLLKLLAQLDAEGRHPDAKPSRPAILPPASVPIPSPPPPPNAAQLTADRVIEVRPGVYSTVAATKEETLQGGQERNRVAHEADGVHRPPPGGEPAQTGSAGKGLVPLLHERELTHGW